LLKNQVSIKLNEQISCEYICKNIQQLINYYTNQKIKTDNCVLVCELKEIQDSNQSLLPRIGVNYE
jgi:hypothetical protein